MEMDNLSLDKISMSESLEKVWSMGLEETKDPLIMMENGKIISLKEMESWKSMDSSSWEDLRREKWLKDYNIQ